MLTLDREKPFGVVTPPENNAHFMQGPYYYDAEGKLVEGLLTHEQRAAMEEAKLEAEADAAAEAARQQKLAELRAARDGHAPVTAPPVMPPEQGATRTIGVMPQHPTVPPAGALAKLAPQAPAAPPAPPPAHEPEPELDADGNPILDLKAWLRGEAKYQFFAVRGAVAREFHFSGHTKDQIVNYLVDTAKLVPADEVRV